MMFLVKQTETEINVKTQKLCQCSNSSFFFAVIGKYPPQKMEIQCHSWDNIYHKSSAPSQPPLIHSFRSQQNCSLVKEYAVKKPVRFKQIPIRAHFRNPPPSPLVMTSQNFARFFLRLLKRKRILQLIQQPDSLFVDEAAWFVGFYVQLEKKKKKDLTGLKKCSWGGNSRDRVNSSVRHKAFTVTLQVKQNLPVVSNIASTALQFNLNKAQITSFNCLI